MTVCIAARVEGRWALASDTYCSDDNLLYPNNRFKWYPHGGYWVAAAGSFTAAHKLLVDCDEPALDLNTLAKRVGDQNEDVEILVLDPDTNHSYYGTLWQIDANGGLLDLSTPYWAIGSGASIALGYLRSAVDLLSHDGFILNQDVIHQCMRATSDLCPHVRAPFHVRML